MEKVGAKQETHYAGPKLYRKNNAIIGTAGSHILGEAFVNWYGTKKRKPAGFGKDADFEALVLTSKGLYHFDEFLSGGLVSQPWFAIGSGAHAALGALHAGATPQAAVEIACKVDTMSGEPIQIMELKDEQKTEGVG